MIRVNVWWNDIERWKAVIRALEDQFGEDFTQYGEPHPKLRDALKILEELGDQMENSNEFEDIARNKYDFKYYPREIVREFIEKSLGIE
jgi:hypothetical protein